LTQHLEAEAGWRGVAERSDGVAGVGRREVEMELRGGARLVVTEGEDVIAGLRKREEETYFGQYANAAQAGMGRARARGLREKRGRAGGGLGGEAGRADWPLGRLGRKRRKISFPNKNWIFELTRLWKFVEGDLGGILT
jgi:hypothetical protein